MAVIRILSKSEGDIIAQLYDARLRADWPAAVGLLRKLKRTKSTRNDALAVAIEEEIAFYNQIQLEQPVSGEDDWTLLADHVNSDIGRLQSALQNTTTDVDKIDILSIIAFGLSVSNQNSQCINLSNLILAAETVSMADAVHRLSFARSLYALIRANVNLSRFNESIMLYGKLRLLPDEAFLKQWKFRSLQYILWQTSAQQFNGSDLSKLYSEWFVQIQSSSASARPNFVAQSAVVALAYTKKLFDRLKAIGSSHANKNSLSQADDALALAGSLVFLCTDFPRADEENALMLRFCDLLFAMWQFNGCMEEDALVNIAIINRAATKICISEKLLRHLFYYYRAAKKADFCQNIIVTYRERIKAAHRAASERKKRRHAELLASGNLKLTAEMTNQVAVNGNKSTQRPDLSPERHPTLPLIDLADISKDPKCDTDEVIVMFLADTAMFLVKECGNKEEQALEICQDILEQLKVSASRISAENVSKVMLTVAYVQLNAAANARSREARDERVRNAKASLQRSLKIQPENCRAAYLCALNEAMQMNVTQAIETLESAHVQSQALPPRAYELLALLRSSQMQYETAIELSLVALDKFIEQFERDVQREMISLGQIYDQIAEFADLHQTTLLLFSKAHGAVEAVAAQKLLFNLFSYINGDRQKLNQALCEAAVSTDAQNRTNDYIQQNKSSEDARKQFVDQVLDEYERDPASTQMPRNNRDVTEDLREVKGSLQSVTVSESDIEKPQIVVATAVQRPSVAPSVTFPNTAQVAPQNGISAPSLNSSCASMQAVLSLAMHSDDAKELEESYATREFSTTTSEQAQTSFDGLEMVELSDIESSDATGRSYVTIYKRFQRALLQNLGRLQLRCPSTSRSLLASARPAADIQNLDQLLKRRWNGIIAREWLVAARLYADFDDYNEAFAAFREARRLVTNKENIGSADGDSDSSSSSSSSSVTVDAVSAAIAAEGAEGAATVAIPCSTTPYSFSGPTETRGPTRSVIVSTEPAIGPTATAAEVFAAPVEISDSVDLVQMPRRDQEVPFLVEEAQLCEKYGDLRHAQRLYECSLTDDPHNEAACIGLSRNLVEQYLAQAQPHAQFDGNGGIARADQLLTMAMRGRGWNLPETWFYLATSREIIGGEPQLAEMFEYALHLENCRPIRRFECLLAAPVPPLGAPKI